MKLSAAAIVAACGTAALALLPLAVPPYYTGLMIPFYGYAIALLGFNLLFGYTGLLSFGHAMFLGVGAYGAAILSGVAGVKSFELVLLTVMFAACVIALPVGALCVRYTGIFFGMLTLAFGMLFHSFLFKFYYLTGGDSGMRVARMNILGLEFASLSRLPSVLPEARSSVSEWGSPIPSWFTGLSRASSFSWPCLAGSQISSGRSWAHSPSLYCRTSCNR